MLKKILAVLLLAAAAAVPAAALSYEQLSDAQRRCLLEKAAASLGYSHVPYEDGETMVLVHEVAYELYLNGECQEGFPSNREQAILAFANDPATTQSQLEQAVKLGYEYGGIPGAGDYVATQVATSILVRRAGWDRVYGTADDDRFETLADLYQMTSAGPESMEGLEIWAVRHYLHLGGPSAILEFLNDRKRARARSLETEVGLDRRAAENLIRWRDGGADVTLRTRDDEFAAYPRIFGSADPNATNYRAPAVRWPAWSVEDVPQVGVLSIQKIYDFAMSGK